MTRLWRRAVPHLVLASLLISPIAMIGCAEHAQYQVYDPDDGTYHYWNNGEGVYYQQWEVQTHRRHRDYRRRDQDEQRQYWQWRKDHQHNDRRDRDNRRDRDRH